MKLTCFAIAVSVTLVAGWATPVLAADKEERQMMADIRMLQEQAQQTQNLLQTLTATLTDAIKQVDTRLTTRFDDQADATRKVLADQKATITSISGDLRSVREKMDDNTTRLGSLALEVQALRQLVSASRATTAPEFAPDAAAPPAAAAQSSPTPQALAGASPQKMWDEAQGDYSAGQYDLAIEGFQSYIRSSPQSPQADDAQVMICNAYLIDGKYQQAVDACDTAIRTYPNGSQTAQAYYRKGLALKDLKQTDRAREAFDYVIKTFPESDEAILAAQDAKKP